MLKLIKLEIKKHKLLSYTKGVAIANIGIIVLLIGLHFAEKSEGTIAFGSYESAFEAIGTIVRTTFLIFSSVLIARLIIDEYKSNSITLMFMYPIKRKKIFTAKLTIVVCFAFITIFFSTLLISSLLYLIDSIFDIIPSTLTIGILRKEFFGLILGTLASAGMSLIPLYFGMRKKSVPATIVSAIIFSTLVNSNSFDVSLFSFIAIPISLAIIGVMIAYFSIRNIETTDV